MLTDKFLEENFKKLAKNGGLSHAYLFFGEEENDKGFFFAQSLANFLENGVFEPPKFLLRETLMILPDNSVEPGKKNSMGIDAVREIKHFLWQKPIASSYRAAIVKNADVLTPEAQHAVLKIVEEPPENSLLIFIVKNQENLLPTLASRFQKIYFSSPAGKTNNFKKSDFLKLFGKETPDEEFDGFFRSLLASLAENKMKNVGALKETLKSLKNIKQFKTNKRLQIRALMATLYGKKG
ncbi:hypothetical protein HZB06_02100 [Candidatus Wolfebacteria bacterium]|nr:hypothetical protein [Candidatus Wolfebacteria bacterium]